MLFLYTMITSEKVLIISFKKKSKQNHNQTKPKKPSSDSHIITQAGFKLIVILLPESFGCSNYGREPQHLRMPQTPVPDNLNTFFCSLKVPQKHMVHRPECRQNIHTDKIKIHLKKKKTLFDGHSSL